MEEELTSEEDDGVDEVDEEDLETERMHHHTSVNPLKKKFKESQDFNDEDENAADIEDGDLIETEARGDEFEPNSKPSVKK